MKTKADLKKNNKIHKSLMTLTRVKRENTQITNTDFISLFIYNIWI